MKISLLKQMRSAPLKLQMILFGVGISSLPFLFLQHLPYLGIFFALFSAFPLFCVGFVHGLRPMMMSILLGSFLVYRGGGFELLAFYLMLTALPSFLWTYTRLNFETLKHGYWLLENINSVFSIILFLILNILSYYLVYEVGEGSIRILSSEFGYIIYLAAILFWGDMLIINSFLVDLFLRKHEILPNKVYKEVSWEKILIENHNKSYRFTLSILLAFIFVIGYYLSGNDNLMLGLFLFIIVVPILRSSSISFDLFRSHSARQLFISSLWRILIFGLFYGIAMFNLMALFLNVPLPLQLR